MAKISKKTNNQISKEVMGKLRDIVEEYGADDGRPIFITLPLKDSPYKPMVRILDTSEETDEDGNGYTLNPNSKDGERKVANLKAGACFVIKDLLDIVIPGGKEEDNKSPKERRFYDQMAYDILCTMLATVIANGKCHDDLDVMDSETFSDFVDETYDSAAEAHKCTCGSCDKDDDEDEDEFECGMMKLSRHDAKKMLSKLLDPDVSPEEMKEFMEDLKDKMEKEDD